MRTHVGGRTFSLLAVHAIACTCSSLYMGVQVDYGYAQDCQGDLERAGLA
jgi:hypothetical protein